MAHSHYISQNAFKGNGIAPLADTQEEVPTSIQANRLLLVPPLSQQLSLLLLILQLAL